jgi:histidinol-phosphate aminotransferase
MSSARDKAQPVGDGFAPYKWAPSVAEVAARHGLPAQAVLKLDQNTPPLPGVPQIPLAQSMAQIHAYPDGTYGELCEAAASYTGTRPENVVIGAGADDLILLLGQVFVGPGTRAAIDPPTYPVYRIATTIRGGEITGPDGPADLYWICNPNNPLGTWIDPEPIVERARATDAIVVVDEAYFEFGARSCAPWVDELENLVVIRTMSKAFGFAGLRVGYAVAHPETAALLTERRPPAPISGFAASIAAAALREPRLGDVEATIAERERVRDALVDAGYESWPTATNFVYVKSDEPLGERLEAAGIVVRVYADGIRVTLGRPAENDRFLAVLGVEPGRSGGREATVLRTTSETALRLTLALDGTSRTRVETGIGFLDHLLTLLAFHAGFDLELLAGGDLAVDEHHTVEDVHASFGSALSQALGSREGVARYGSAVVPMDEARSTAAVDLVRRAHAEIDLAFAGERVGSLAVSLLRHALERFAIEAGCTVHVDAAGSDDHHVAEAAYKALGQALRQAVAPGSQGIRSTKGAA